MAGSKTIVAMLEEMKTNMITADTLQKNNKRLSADLNTAVSMVVALAIGEHIKPLVAQRALEQKFAELIHHMERLEVEHRTEEGLEDVSHSNRSCAADRITASPLGPRLALRRHLPEHIPVNPVSGRATKITGFPTNLTPNKLFAFLKHLFTGDD